MFLVWLFDDLPCSLVKETGECERVERAKKSEKDGERRRRRNKKEERKKFGRMGKTINSNKRKAKESEQN